MKKMRGKKKKVSASPKKVKKSFFIDNKVSIISLILIVLSLAVLLVFNLGSTGNSITGNAGINNHIDSGGVLGSTDSSSSGSSSFSITDSPPQIVLSFSNFLNLGSTWRELIISLVVLVIIFAGLYDIIELTSIFSNQWVMYILAGGFAIIFCLTSVVYGIVTRVISIAATVGAAGIVIELIVAVVLFIGLSFGNTFIAKFIAKRKGQKSLIQTITSADEAKNAIRGLREIQREFKSKE